MNSLMVTVEHYFDFYKNLKKNVYCGPLLKSIEFVSVLFLFCVFGFVVLAPQPGIEHTPLHWKAKS